MTHVTWDAWQTSGDRDQLSHRDRVPMLRPVPYERSAAFGEEGGQPARGKALSLNVSNGGLCLLMDRVPARKEILRVQVPLFDTLVQTPTLASVRWVKRLPFDHDGPYVVGLQFLL